MIRKCFTSIFKPLSSSSSFVVSNNLSRLSNCSRFHNNHSIINLQINRFVSQSHSNSIGQDHLLNILKKNFPIASEINVSDISGGCGAMFEVYIKSEQFKGMTKVKQHLTVSKILQEEIKNMHGIRIFTEES